MSRLRRPMGRLRDTPIWAKLGLIMIVPTIATVIVGTNGLVSHIRTQSDAERARDLTTLSQAAGDLVHDLQNERATAAMFLSTPTSQAQNKDAYVKSQDAVEEAKRPYSQQRNTISGVPETFDRLLSKIDENLANLPGWRSQVLNDKFTLNTMATNYQRLIESLIAIRDSATQLAGDNTLAERERVAAEVARIKDFMAQRRVIILEMLSTQVFTPSLRTEYIGTTQGERQARESFATVASQAERELFEQVVSGPKLRQSDKWQGYLAGQADANVSDVPFDRAEWDTAMREHGDLVRQVEASLDNDVVAQATELRDEVQRQVLIETGLLLGMLLLAILFAWLVARSMARSLRELRHGALAVAQFGLPQAVARLRDPSLSTQLSPAQVATQIAEPLPVRSKDEFGQVTEAFNAVHLEAVRTAAEQAALRSSVSTMFVNLARRSQILVDRLIGHLDRLERGEEDPDRLAELFQLDHLATRMRRNDENLLVLAGADSTRVQREPAALIDVLRAAQSEVEHYTRIEFGVVDRDIEVAAHAVNDMVHLVAELFDNATAFSPPNSTVLVEARRLGDGAMLSVEDRGIGISREQLRDLNDRLANPPMVDVAVSRMMGLVVVARLANRHGVKVELRPADRERGTVAEVGLPTSVLVSSSAAARLPGGAPAFGGDPASTQVRPQFAEPLALESGRAGYPGGRPFDPNPPMPSGGMLGAGGSRSVPAWSDLTGAPADSGFATNGANGSNGANGFRGSPANDGMPPVSPGPSGFGGPEGFAGDLPHRRNGENYRPDGDPGFGPAIPRQLPPSPGQGQGRNPFVPPVSAPPVPPISAPPTPAGHPPYGGRPMSSPPVSGPPVSSPPTANPSAPNPPAWPPVSADRDGNGAPHVPESLAAALDMTAELPRYRPDRAGTGNQPGTPPPRRPEDQAPVGQPRVDNGSTVDRPADPQSGPRAQQSDAERSAAAAAAAHDAAVAEAAEAQATAAAQIAAAQARQRSSDGQNQYADETMELPIFRELESAWFTTAKRPTPNSGDDGTISQRYPTGEPARPAEVPQQAPPESRDLDRETVGAGAATSNGAGMSSNPWQTAADEGWQAARAAAETPVDATTTAGLPKRKPMAQLVPGGVDRAENSTQRRTPEAVRGLLSAYHRGVQRGRTKEQSTNPEETSGGQQSFQAGKEHEA